MGRRTPQVVADFFGCDRGLLAKPETVCDVLEAAAHACGLDLVDQLWRVESGLLDGTVFYAGGRVVTARASDAYLGVELVDVDQSDVFIDRVKCAVKALRSDTIHLERGQDKIVVRSIRVRRPT
jgi:hypothetical protein